MYFMAALCLVTNIYATDDTTNAQNSLPAASARRMGVGPSRRPHVVQLQLRLIHEVPVEACSRGGSGGVGRQASTASDQYNLTGSPGGPGRLRPALTAVQPSQLAHVPSHSIRDGLTEGHAAGHRDLGHRGAAHRARVVDVQLRVGVRMYVCVCVF